MKDASIRMKIVNNTFKRNNKVLIEYIEQFINMDNDNNVRNNFMYIKAFVILWSQDSREKATILYHEAKEDNGQICKFKLNLILNTLIDVAVNWTMETYWNQNKGRFTSDCGKCCNIKGNNFEIIK